MLWCGGVICQERSYLITVVLHFTASKWLIQQVAVVAVSSDLSLCVSNGVPTDSSWTVTPSDFASVRVCSCSSWSCVPRNTISIQLERERSYPRLSVSDGFSGIDVVLLEQTRQCSCDMCLQMFFHISNNATILLASWQTSTALRKLFTHFTQCYNSSVMWWGWLYAVILYILWPCH